MRNGRVWIDEPGEVTEEKLENLGSLAKMFEPYPLDTRDALRGLKKE